MNPSVAQSAIGKVGYVRLAGRETGAFRELGHALQGWLHRTGWSRGVALVSAPSADASRFEIEFVPGEYQSNGPRKLVYADDAASPHDVARLLEEWLETRL